MSKNSSNKYGGVIWTNHAMERLEQRKFSQDLALQAFNFPDIYKDGKKSGTKICIKKIDEKTITLIIKENDDYQWVVLSCWIDPPLLGSIDAKKRERYKHYQKQGFWGKFWIDTIKLIFG